MNLAEIAQEGGPPDFQDAKLVRPTSEGIILATQQGQTFAIELSDFQWRLIVDFYERRQNQQFVP